MKNQITIKSITRPVRRIVSVPGSKSDTNRALILAALTKGKVTIKGHLISDDTNVMIDCLKTLGVKISESKNSIMVAGSIFDVKEQDYILNAGLSGTTIRFLTAMLAIVPGIKMIGGKEGLNKRPIGDLVTALQKLGAEITYEKKEGFPPLKITSTGFKKKTATINGSVSSQYLSALLMIAPLSGIERILVKGQQISKSYIDLTLDSMKKFGVTVKNNKYKSYDIPQKEYRCREVIVEGDFSAACYFAAIAVLTQSCITIKNCNPNSIQGDKEFFSIIEKMGNKIEWKDDRVIVSGKKLLPVNVDMENCPDQAQTLAVLCAFAKGKSVLRGIQSLRVKETERVVALENELSKMGIKTKSTKRTLSIRGGEPVASEIDTYGDHRMAMSFAVAGTKLKGIRIDNPSVVSKTFPKFWEELLIITEDTK